MRIDGQVHDAAVLIATGIRADGKRAMPGVPVAVGEHEAHWRQFLQSLVQRGLTGVQLIVSDAHEGLQAARRAVSGSAPWQRCQFHLQQNAQAYTPRQELKAEVAAAIRATCTAPNRADADRLLARTVQKYATTASKLATWLETAIPEGLTVFSLPAAHRTRLRTVNALERLNREIRRRTHLVDVFPNEASCLRLVTALAVETSDEWEAGKVYLTLTD